MVESADPSRDNMPTSPRGSDNLDCGVSCYVAARIIGCHHSQVRRLINAGKLTAYRAGRSIRLRLSAVEAYRDRNRIEPGRRHEQGAPDPRVRTTDRRGYREAVATLTRLGVEFSE